MAVGQPDHRRDCVLGLQGRKPLLAPLEGLLSARLVRILQTLTTDLTGAGMIPHTLEGSEPLPWVPSVHS